MRIYTFIMAVFVPSVINSVLNILIFIHVRSSSRRVQDQSAASVTNGNNTQHVKFNRRDLSLLRQMIFMFSIFIGGWSPVYLSGIIGQFTSINSLVLPITAIFGEICIFSLIINLFVQNHELTQYIINNIRQLIGQ